MTNRCSLTHKQKGFFETSVVGRMLQEWGTAFHLYCINATRYTVRREVPLQKVPSIKLSKICFYFESCKKSQVNILQCWLIASVAALFGLSKFRFYTKKVIPFYLQVHCSAVIQLNRFHTFRTPYNIWCWKPDMYLVYIRLKHYYIL